MATTTVTSVKVDDLQESFDVEQTLRAAKALVSHIKKDAQEKASTSTKRNLLSNGDNDDDDDSQNSLGETPVWLTITTKRHIREAKDLKPHRLTLPHPLHTDAEQTICIISADPQRAYKNIVASDAFPEALRKRITRVIDLKHLKAKFKQYEAQRKLLSEHDIFLGDDRIINRLPQALGKTFYKSTVKRPIPVEFAIPRTKDDDGKRVKRGPKPADGVNARPPVEIAAEIEKAIGAALVHLSPSTSTSIRVGTADMSPEALAANIESVSKQVTAKFVTKNKKNGVRGVFIKGPNTAALPIWQTSELWLDGEQDVVADGSEKAKQIEAAKAETQANVGKKRKALAASGETAAHHGSGDEDKEMEDKEADKPKAKKAKKLPESNDSKLDKEVAELKSKLKKRKSAAKKSMEE